MTTPPIALFDLDMTLADYEGRLRTGLARLASPGDPPIGPIHGNLPTHIKARAGGWTWIGTSRDGIFWGLRLTWGSGLRCSPRAL